MSHNFKPVLAVRRRRERGHFSDVAWYPLAMALTGLSASAAENPAKPLPPLPEFRQLAPSPSIRSAAEASKIILEGIEPPLERTTLSIGDQVTALVSLTEGTKVKQWAIALEAVEANEKEKQNRSQPMVFHTSTGHVLRFGSERAALAIRTLGPLTAADAGRIAAAPPMKLARATVDIDFLALGLHQPAVMAESFRKARAGKPELPPQRPEEGLQIGMEPFPQEKVAASRKAAEAVGLTESNERSIIGSVLALVQFFQIASQTPGLQEVVKSVIDIPWWSIIRSGGKMPGINLNMMDVHRRLNAAPWGVRADLEVWTVGCVLKLNDQPALVCQLAVLEPRPPLLPSAGIIGLAAARPNGKGPVLTLQIVAARGAAPAPPRVEATAP
jgi:hypothetical protein